MPIENPTAAPSQQQTAAKPAPLKVGFVSLGCPKNLVDSERMLGLLKIDGYELVNEPDGADFVVENEVGDDVEAGGFAVDDG